MVLNRVLRSFVKSYWMRTARSSYERQLSREPAKFDLQRANWDKSLSDPNAFYSECTRYFLKELPAELRQHRAYFSEPGSGRGFGENAFHTMWYLLLEHFKPANFLEIGVFRGQVISLVALWSRLARTSCEVWGISPFSGSGDSSSKYRVDLDYYQDTLRNFDQFKLPHPRLLKASSLDPEAVRLIASKPWDMIYIDGNHDYDVAQKDWEHCAASVKVGGVIVLDDAGLNTHYTPQCFSTAGIAGPSQLAQEIDRSRFKEILQVGHNRAFEKIAL